MIRKYLKSEHYEVNIFQPNTNIQLIRNMEKLIKYDYKIYIFTNLVLKQMFDSCYIQVYF